MNPPDAPPQALRHAVWRVIWTVIGLGLCALAVKAMAFKIGQVADGLAGREAVDAIGIGICVAMLLVSFGFGALGLGISASGDAPAPVGDRAVPYDDPGENARQRRLRVRARLHRAACFLLGLALVLLGPQMLMDGLNDGPRDPALRQPKGGGSVGGGFVMTLIGLVLVLYSVVAMGPRAARRHEARVPAPTPPHAEHDFSS